MYILGAWLTCHSNRNEEIQATNKEINEVSRREMSLVTVNRLIIDQLISRS